MVDWIVPIRFRSIITKSNFTMVYLTPHLLRAKLLTAKHSSISTQCCGSRYGSEALGPDLWTMLKIPLKFQDNFASLLFCIFIVGGRLPDPELYGLKRTSVGLTPKKTVFVSTLNEKKIFVGSKIKGPQKTVYVSITLLVSWVVTRVYIITLIDLL